LSRQRCGLFGHEHDCFFATFSLLQEHFGHFLQASGHFRVARGYFAERFRSWRSRRTGAVPNSRLSRDKLGTAAAEAEGGAVCCPGFAGIRDSWTPRRNRLLLVIAMACWRWAGHLCQRRVNSGLTATKTRCAVGVLALPEGPVGPAIGFCGAGCGAMGLCVSYSLVIWGTVSCGKWHSHNLSTRCREQVSWRSEQARTA
jgi:hypothetical protein